MTQRPHRDIWRPGQVVERPLDTLMPSPANARTHSPAQLHKLGRSIQAFGFTSPVLVDAADRIVAGHGRVAAARDLGMATVPTVRLDHLTPAQCRALALADNRIAELAGWDQDVLRIELGGLLELDDSVDLSLTGFEDAEIDIVLHDAADPAPDPGSDPGPHGGPPVSRPGDCWTLGRHALLCGDPAAPQTYAALLGAEPAAMLFTTPPEVAPGLRGALAAAIAASRPGALHYLCDDWRGLGELAAAAAGLYAEQVDFCIWDRGASDRGGRDRGAKAAGGTRSPYRPQHELVAVYRTQGAEKHEPGGRRRRQRTNLWRYPVDARLAAGPPVPLIADAILDATAAGEVVLDPWGGCGGTLLAAEQTGRRARLLEAAPRRADLAIWRWQAATGGTATLAGTGGDPGDDFETVSQHRNQEITNAA